MSALNVFTGPDSLKNYYDPDLQPPVPLVEIPRKLNPFHDDGVRIYAKMMSTLPANNVKALPGQSSSPQKNKLFNQLISDSTQHAST